MRSPRSARLEVSAKHIYEMLRQSLVDQVIANTMFGEEGLQALNADCPDLLRMDVANSQLVSKKGLQALYAAPCLQRMDAANCQLVSKEGHHALYAGGLGLQHTVAANGQLVSESGIACRLPGFAAHGRAGSSCAPRSSTPLARPSRLCPARPCRAMRRPTCRLA